MLYSWMLETSYHLCLSFMSWEKVYWELLESRIGFCHFLMMIWLLLKYFPPKSSPACCCYYIQIAALLPYCYSWKPAVVGKLQSMQNFESVFWFFCFCFFLCSLFSLLQLVLLSRCNSLPVRHQEHKANMGQGREWLPGLLGNKEREEEALKYF